MAANETLAIWEAVGGVPPASAAATLDTRNGHTVLDFDADANESAHFCSVLPKNYAGGNLTAKLHWMATSATSGNVRWRAAFERLEAAGPDLDADGFQTAVEANGAANATSGKVTVTSLTLTALDGGVAGDAFRIAVTRVATDGTNDTMTGDAELLRVELVEA
ncbi:MAG: hypothetical protein AB7G28_20135 [Pirellulales bacterium]